MKKDEFKAIKLGKGEIHRYEGDKLNLLIYQTNDSLEEFSLIAEKEKRGLVIEPPSFVENATELEKYLHSQGIKVEGLILAYHQAGGASFKKAQGYSTRNAVEFGTKGRGKMMVEQFAKTFGSVFDPTFHEVTGYIDEDSASIAGITLNIQRTPDAFDLEIPEINAKYIHLLGHDVHSILGSPEDIRRELAKLESCIGKGYDLVLSSHYPAEDMDDVRRKIGYLKQLRRIAAQAESAGEFKRMMRQEFPGYRGDHYLDMTAQALFH